MQDAPVGIPGNDSSVAILSTSTTTTVAGTPDDAGATTTTAPEVPTKNGGETGWLAGSGPPRAAVYDSEEERLRALMPMAEESALMENRKLKVDKLISKKKAGSTLNPAKRYQQRKEERLLENKMKLAAAAAAIEAAKESDQAELMFAEERRSWDAYELNIRNHSRMIAQARVDRAAAAAKRRQEEAHRATCEEEGLTFDDGVVVQYRRWRASPALAAVLPAHPCPAHAMRLSSDARWILTGGDDLVVRLWDTKAFTKRLEDADEIKAARARERAGAVAADVALGWEVVRELVGHTAAVRDVEFNPLFEGPPPPNRGCKGTDVVGHRKARAGSAQSAAGGGSYKDGARGGKEGGDRGEAKTAAGGVTVQVRLEHMVVAASADLTVRIWDLSFNVRTPRFTLRGHKGVVYACRFQPSGERLASCSADGTVRLWDVLQGVEVFCYEGHASPVTSLCFSPSGRYLVSCSDIGERAIRVWFGGMPLYDRDPVPFGLRLRWARSGLIKRLRASSEPSAMAFFLNRQEEREVRESSDEDAGEKEFKERLRVPKSVQDQCSQNPCPSQAVANGFSLTVTLLNDSGKDVRTEEYYRGCKLVLRARGLNKFTGLYVAGVSAEGLWEGFDSRGGTRYGSFFKDVPEGMAITAGRCIVAGEDINKDKGGINEVVLRWKASTKEGVGWLMFRAAFRFPTNVGRRIVLGRETVWVTLRERAPPTSPAAILSTKKLRPRKRNFDTVGRTRLFARAIKSGDWAEAAMMLSGSAKMNFGKIKAVGAAEVTDEIRKVLGKNIIVANGAAVGVSWTSIGMTHEPPPAPEPDPQTPSSQRPNSHDSAVATNKASGSPVSDGGTTVPAGGAASVRRRRQRQGDGTARGTVEGDPREAMEVKERKEEGAGGGKERGRGRRSSSLPAKKQRGASRRRGEGSRRGGGGSGGGGDSGDGSGGGKRGARQARRREKGQGRSRWRNHTGALSEGSSGGGGGGARGSRGSARQVSWKTNRRQRRRAGGRGGGGGGSRDPSSGEDEATAVRAAAEKRVRTELNNLKRLRDAGVESWKELGVETGALALAKARRLASAKTSGGSKGLLAATGIKLKDPQANLKVLVWNGQFGADVSELRMPLPEMYPLSSIPYDQNEGVGVRALGEAIAIGDSAAEAMMEEIRAERKRVKNEIAQVDRFTDALLNREESLRDLACRRRDAFISPSDLGSSFPSPAPRLAPLRLVADNNEDENDNNSSSKDNGIAPKALVPLETNVFHSKLERKTVREKRRKQEDKLLRRTQPPDPPKDYDLTRRRGGIGVLPGAAPLVQIPVVGDWENKLAREMGGLLREFEARFGGLICHQDAINAVAYSPDGRRLASASSDGTVKLWDPSAGKQVRVLSGQHEGLPVWDVAWSGDSVFLVSCGADRSVVIWNTTAAGPFVRRFLGHSDHVRRCSFADTRGEAVLSCGSDGTVRKWVLTPNVPAPPPKPFVTHKTRTWIMLNWRPASGSNEEITAYVVSWRLGRKGSFDEQLTVAGDQLRRDVTGLFPGSLYFFRVAAVNRMGQGPWSETSDTIDTEMDVPLAMGRPLVEVTTARSITISFFAPRPTLPKMKIRRFVVQAKGGGFEYEDGDPAEFTWVEAMAGGNGLKASGKITPTTVSLDATASDSGAGAGGGKLSKSSRRLGHRSQKRKIRRKPHHHLMSVTYSGLRAGTDYHLRVAGVNSVGKGVFSFPTYTVRTPAVRPGPCPPPTALSRFLTAINVGWAEGDDGGGAVTGFYLRPTGGGEDEETSCSRTKRSHLFEGLRKGQPYSFQVCAANNQGLGPWSEPSEPTHTLSERPAPPRAPAVPLHSHAPPGPLFLWLSLSLPEDDGGDPVIAMLLETREHGGTKAPEWSRCERHPVPSPTRDLVPHHDHHGPLDGEAGARTGVSAPPTVAGRPTHCCDSITVLVSGLKPRTYYSFRTAAVNGQGASDSGLPCRRIRTSAPRPPSWEQAFVATADPPHVPAAAADAGAASALSGESRLTASMSPLVLLLGDKEAETKGTKGSTEASPAASEPVRPRAVCSGLGACTIVWDEPHSNGAPITSYEVETATLGREIVTPAGEATREIRQQQQAEARDGREGESISVSNSETIVESNNTTVLARPPTGECEAGASAALPPLPSGNSGNTSALIKLSPSSSFSSISQTLRATDESTTEPPRVRVALVSSRKSDGVAVAITREVTQSSSRSVVSHMRHTVIRGLLTGEDYAFRVAATNSAGLGDAGPWSAVVWVADPADDSD